MRDEDGDFEDRDRDDLTFHQESRVDEAVERDQERRAAMKGATRPCPTCGALPRILKGEPVAWAVQIYCRDCYEPGCPIGTAESLEGAVEAWNASVEARDE